MVITDDSTNDTGYQIQGGQSDMMNNANCLLIGYFVERLASMDTSYLTNMVIWRAAPTWNCVYIILFTGYFVIEFVLS